MGFASNQAAKALLEHGQHAFDLLDERFRKETEKLINYRGLSAVLGYFFVLGNRYNQEKLCMALKEYPPDIVVLILGHAPLALGTEPVSVRMRNDICSLQEHENSEIREWAIRFGQQVKWTKN